MIPPGTRNFYSVGRFSRNIHAWFQMMNEDGEQALTLFRPTIHLPFIVRSFRYSSEAVSSST